MPINVLLFNNGNARVIIGSSQKVYDDFMSADSKGSFYTANIKGKFGATE